MRLKHLGVRIITCGLTRGRLDLPYNNSENILTSMVWNSACFYIGKRLSFSTSAVQRVFKRNKRKFYSHDFTSAVKCRRHHQEDRVRLLSCRDLKDKRKGERKAHWKSWLWVFSLSLVKMLYNWIGKTILFCFGEYWNISVLHSIVFEIFVSLKLYISSIKLLSFYKSTNSDLAHRTTWGWGAQPVNHKSQRKANGRIWLVHWRRSIPAKFDSNMRLVFEAGVDRRERKVFYSNNKANNLTFHWRR